MILMVMLAAMGGFAPGQAEKPLRVMVCSPPGLKKPSLTMVDAKGKCGQGYKAMEGKDKKPMYCVNTEHPKPAECKLSQPALPKK